MRKLFLKNQKNIILSKEDYLKLLEIYQKLKEIFTPKKKKKILPKLKTLYGIWEGVKVEEKDFEKVKKSLFKPSS